MDLLDPEHPEYLVDLEDQPYHGYPVDPLYLVVLSYLVDPVVPPNPVGLENPVVL